MRRVRRALRHAFVGRRLAAGAVSDGAKPPAGGDVVVISFHGGAHTTTSVAGASLADAAAEAGADIVYGCCTGSCGVCEVELVADGRAPVVARACVAAVPAGCSLLEVDTLPDDAAWSQDGWDT